jgi:hypothetical protein
MADLRTQLALVLGVGLGLVLIAFPDLVIRAHTVGRVPHDRTGQYGEDSDRSDWVRHAVRAVGAGLVVAAVVIWL